jgi:hypothetical protein
MGVVLNWTPTTYPLVIDAWAPQVDAVTDVMCSHPNSLATAVYAIETKLGIDNDIVKNVGGLQFDPVGQAANPGGVGEPTIWVDNSGGPGFPLQYTDDLGNTYNLTAGSFIGTNYLHGGLVGVGDLCYITGADTLDLAGATPGNPARGLVLNLTGAICTILYGGEISNGAWALTPGATYYLGDLGAFVLAAGIPVGRTIVQEIGFARNATTLIFRPTLVTWE